MESGDATLAECRNFQEEDNKGNIENTYVYFGTLKVQVVQFRGLDLDIDSLLGPWPWCIHAQRGNFGNHDRGHLPFYGLSRRGAPMNLKGVVRGDIV